MDIIGEDLLQNILSRLPALSFASAACVSRSWNLLCHRLLSRPKLSSALSLNPSLTIAVTEVLDKVLSEPIRPHFAIAYVSPDFPLPLTHELITKKLGSSIPVITSECYGIIGKDVLTSKFKEVQWDVTNDEDVATQVDDSSALVTSGIMLIVGFLPGLKVDVVPLLHSDEDPQVAMIDKFVMDVRECSTSVSGCTSPVGLIMFGGPGTDMRPVLDKMDIAMSMETFIVGYENGDFLYKKIDDSRNSAGNSGLTPAAVALLFARDRNKPDGVGETQFHVTLSTGVSAIGSTYKAVSVRKLRDECTTWLTAKREGEHQILDGESILNDINDEIGDRIEYPALYVGVTERRKCSIGLEKVKWVTSMAFHEVLGGNEEYLFVNGIGIQTGDSFRFYQSNPDSALSFSRDVSENFRRLKQDHNHKSSGHASRSVADSGKEEVFGGIIFSCCGRGESFFGRPNVDSSPFLENFPGIPLAGAFCGGEIGRGSLSSYSKDPKTPVRCSVHVFSAVYLVMSYTPSNTAR